MIIKNKIKKHLHHLKNKVYCRGDNNEKTRASDDSPSDTDGCAINLGDEHKNEEYEEYIETTTEENYSFKSKTSEGITEEDVIIIILAKTIRAE